MKNWIQSTPKAVLHDHLDGGLRVSTLIELAELRRENTQMKYLRPDSKSQVTLKYSDNNKFVFNRAVSMRDSWAKINKNLSK